MKKFSRELGSAMVDYVIPTAIVGLMVGLGLYALNDSGALRNFVAASLGMKINGTSAYTGTTTTNSDTEESGSDESPPSTVEASISCSSGNCSIDLGEYTLTGIPEDFSEIIETAGTSSGTDVLADLLYKLAEASDLPQAQKDLIKALANSGHDVADTERILENITSANQDDYTLDSTELTQFNTYLDELGSTTTDSKQGLTYFQTCLSNVQDDLSSSTDPTTQVMLGMINILADEIVDMGKDVVFNATTVSANDGGDGGYFNIIEPDTSNRTDLDSALICATGSGADLGYDCK